MRKLIGLSWLALAFLLLVALPAQAHPGGHSSTVSAGKVRGTPRNWMDVVTGERIQGCFLMARDGDVFIERARGNVVVFRSAPAMSKKSTGVRAGVRCQCRKGSASGRTAGGERPLFRERVSVRRAVPVGSPERESRNGFPEKE
jgi:hypothetical protein